MASILVSTQDSLRDAISTERRLEFAFEGQRWHDLVRTGQAETKLAIGKDKLLWPIPARERNVNPELVQNPSC